MTDAWIIALALIQPLIGAGSFLAQLLLIPDRLSQGKFALGGGLVALIASIPLFVLFWFGQQTEVQVAFDWLPALTGLSLRIDALAALMLFLVQLIGFLVLLFSQYYMKNEIRQRRYYGMLMLFLAAMNSLVLLNNILGIFIFWELMGFCSYVLIGYWTEKEKSRQASAKAFLLNRVGDLGFIAAMMMIWLDAGTLNIDGIVASGRDAGSGLQLAAGLTLFFACAAKSAQFPLQVWLPDAMAGPTPVSALIHAATMVAAGVWVLIRMFGYLLPEVLLIIALTGALTALLAALSASVQSDLKKILAYSTISQLGFMMIGIGAGVPDMAFLHLFTHAFFKAGLFLAAAATIHLAAHQEPGKDPQDIRNYTFAFPRNLRIIWMIQAAALAGIPFFSGFISKEGILIGAVEMASGWTWIIPVSGYFTAFLTAFYAGRMIKAVTGTGEKIKETLHPAWKIVLFITAAGSLSLFFAPENPFETAASWVLYQFPGRILSDKSHLMLSLMAALISVTGGMLGWYGGLKNIRIHPFRKLFYHHFYLDGVFQSAGKGFLWFSGWMNKADELLVDRLAMLVAALMFRKNKISVSTTADFADRKVIDGFVNGLASWIYKTGGSLGRMQRGRIQAYMLFALLLLLVLAAALIYFVTDIQ